MSYSFDQSKQHSKAIKAMMGDVNVTDIIVSQQSGMGEFNTKKNVHSAQDVVERITDHVQILAHIADQEHFKNNFNASGMLPDKKNHITRLITNEFSFYPKDQPLTPQQFSQIMQNIAEISNNCHSNLHLIFGSFPVLGEDDQVYNMVAHVQCGPKSSIYTFAKSVPSDIDAVYPDTYNPSFMGSGRQPKVLHRGITVDGERNLKFSDIAEKVKTNHDNVANSTFSFLSALKNYSVATDADYLRLKKWLNTLKTELNAISDPTYEPPESMLKKVNDLIAKIGSAKINDVQSIANDLNQLSLDIAQYQKDCKKKYDEFEAAATKPAKNKAITPQDFGKIKIHSVALSLDKISQEIQNNLKDGKTYPVALEQLTHLGQNILQNKDIKICKDLNDAVKNLINKVSNQNTVAQIIVLNKSLQEMYKIAEKSPLDLVEFEKHYDQYSDYLRLLRHHLDNTELKKFEDIQKDLSKIFVKINKKEDLVALDKEAMKKSFDEMTDLFSKVTERYTVKKEEIEAYVNALDNYQKADLVENMVTCLKSDTNRELIQKLLQYCKYVVPEGDKAARDKITAMIEKLDGNDKIANGDLDDLKRLLQPYKAQISNMAYSNVPGMTNTPNINYDSTITWETEGGAKGVTAIDVCLTHHYRDSERNIDNMISEPSSEVLSPNLSQVLTSNSMPIDKNKALAEHITHADIVSSDKSSSLLKNTTSGVRNVKTEKTLPLQEFAAAAKAPPPNLKSKYKKMQFDNSDKDLIVINNPPFGPNCKILKPQVHKLSKLPFKDPLKEMSVDSFTGTYYMGKIQKVVALWQIPKVPAGMDAAVNEFNKSLSDLNYSKLLSATEIYAKIDKLRNDVEKIAVNPMNPTEQKNKTDFLKQIDNLEHYVDIKMISENSCCLKQIERIKPLIDLNQLPIETCPKQRAAMNELNLKLTAFLKRTDLKGEVIVAEFDKAKTAISAITTEDTTNATKKLEDMEKHLKRYYSADLNNFAEKRKVAVQENLRVEDNVNRLD